MLNPLRDSAAGQEDERGEDLSRDQIQYKIGELEAKKRVLETLKNTQPTAELVQQLNQVKQDLESSNVDLSNLANKTERLRQECLSSRILAKISGESQQTPKCAEYEIATTNATDSVSDNSDIYTCVKDLDFQINGVAQQRAAIDDIISTIDDEIEQLQSRLLKVGIKMSNLAQHAANTQDELDSKWLQFQFDSQHYEQETHQSSKSYSVATSFSAGGFLWKVSGSFSYSRAQQDFEQKMNQADLTVKGELLRVNILRPWFRPSLFKSAEYQTVCYFNSIINCFNIGGGGERV